MAHVASFQAIEVLDIRDISASARNITFRQRNIMDTDPSADGSVKSLSCLHTLEHFGLGRYGDPVDYYGYRTGWRNLVRMLAPSARFYFSVPISARQRIEFNAHRIFSLPYLRDLMIGDDFTIESFAFVDDAGVLQTDVDPRSADAQQTFGLNYGCGIFTLRRKP